MPAPRMPARRRRFASGAVAAAVVVTGLVAFGADPPGFEDRPARGPLAEHGGVARGGVEARAATVEALLARRGAALVEKDRGAFLATVDPENARLRTQQERLFDNLADVPLAGWRYELSATEDAALPAAARERVAELGGATFASRVGVGVRIAGLDSDPNDFDEVLAFTPRGGTWYLSARLDAPGKGNRQLWDVGRVHALETDHALVLGLRRQDLPAIAEEVDSAVPRVDAVWGRGWARKVLVLVTRTEDEMAELLGGKPAAYRQLAAVTRGELGAPQGAGAAERVIINPRAYGELSDIGRRVIMVHEITHVAARSVTQPWTPIWLTEGFADYVGYRETGLDIHFIAQELVRDVEDGFSPRRLPADSSFVASSPRLPQAYEMGWLACRLIVERYGGQDALLEFFRAVGAPGGSAAAVDAAFVEVLGITQEAFTREWRDYLRATLT